MNIITACDAVFFHCLSELAKSVRKFYDKPIIVYDLGLTEEQKKRLDAVIIPIQIDPEVNYTGKVYLAPNGNPSTRATHKPFCVQHYFANYSEPMIMVDADCLFNEKIEEKGFDVAVTYTPPRKGEQIYYYNGIINSGVIFFNTPATELVNRWAQNCYQENTTDQKALSDVLEETINFQEYRKVQQWGGLKIRIFDTKIYNDFHLTRKGKILHFINTRHREDIYEKLINERQKGRDIRKTFREIKRGKRSFIDRILSVFKQNR